MRPMFPPKTKEAESPPAVGSDTETTHESTGFEVPVELLPIALNTRENEYGRYIIDAILLECDGDGKCRAVATDARKIAVFEWEDERDLVESSIIVPVRTWRSLWRAIDKAKHKPKTFNACQKTIDGGSRIVLSAEIDRDRVEFVASVMEGKFPPYRDFVTSADYSEHLKPSIEGMPCKAVRVHLGRDVLMQLLQSFDRVQLERDADTFAFEIPVERKGPKWVPACEKPIFVQSLETSNRIPGRFYAIVMPKEQ